MYIIVKQQVIHYQYSAHVCVTCKSKMISKLNIFYFKLRTFQFGSL